MAARILGTTITGTHNPGPGARAASCALHVVFPPELRRSFPLRDKETVIGRDPGLDGLVLDHGTISRRHAALHWQAATGTHTVRDLGSRNGTRADGLSAADVARPLSNGSIVRLGDTLLVHEQDVAAPGDGAEVSALAVPGDAATMRRLRALMARAAKDPAPVLVLGETGTGKERIAREIHRLSGRPGKWVALNCAALSPELVESQLFGHVKGAFTGASEAQPGLFRAAHGGTLFLDEIGDLPLALQPKLLRVLQEGEVLPVGGSHAIRVDVRVVAATHRELARLAGDSFREDLYARLSLWELRVPPLRERRVDLLGWIDRLHAVWSDRRGTPGALRFDADAAEALLRFAWPLNLRGLERLVHELGVVAAHAPIGRATLPSWVGVPAAPVPVPVDADPAPGPDRVPTRDEFIAAFEALDGSVHGLAKRFARDRRQIYRWIEAHGLAERRPRTGPRSPKGG